MYTKTYAVYTSILAINFCGLDFNHKNHENLQSSKIPCLTVANGGHLQGIV